MFNSSNSSNSSNNTSWSIVTEEMVGGQHRVDETETGRAGWGATGEKKRAERTRIVRRRRGVARNPVSAEEKTLAEAGIVRDSAFTLKVDEFTAINMLSRAVGRSGCDPHSSCGWFERGRAGPAPREVEAGGCRQRFRGLPGHADRPVPPPREFFPASLRRPSRRDCSIRDRGSHRARGSGSRRFQVRQNLETWHGSLDCNHKRERKGKKLTRLRVSFPSVQGKQPISPLLSKRPSFRKNFSD